MKASIKHICSIGHQDSFHTDSCWNRLQILEENSEIIAPDYKKYIPSASLRRFSPVLRMAVTAAMECQNNIDAPFGAISIGTSLGCLKDTERFLQTFIQTKGNSISPTAFIQSTHNTIAGAISIALHNHAYNMTHTQNSLSFETALVDALLCVDEGNKNVLLGAADEAIDFLNKLKPGLINRSLNFTSGATCMILEAPIEGRKIIEDCSLDFNNQDVQTTIKQFLTHNGVETNALKLILHSDNVNLNLNVRQVNYEQYTGLYFSSSAFACHLANDFPLAKNEKILIVNHQIQGKLGLILMGV